jgi:mannose-1-phosphate guanylyltransferase
MEISALLLAAGEGTRLRPFTLDWPKCLMPIKGYPLLEYWISLLEQLDVKSILVNTHHKKTVMEEFLNRDRFLELVDYTYEPKFLGTGGTLLANKDFFQDKTTLFIHADNWCHCDFQAFIDFHFNHRPAGTIMTMMTFYTPTPSSCGIVELSNEGIVQKFHEKVNNPPGNLANAAIYLLEPEVLDILPNLPSVGDFDIDVIPSLLGKIATWENTNIHRDIGTLESLIKAQNDPVPSLKSLNSDEWQRNFEKNSIHKSLKL